MYKEILIPSEFIILKMISYLQSLKQLKGLIIVPLHVKIPRQSIICKQILIENHRILFVGFNGNDYKKGCRNSLFR